jgi:hypothetical protein
MSIRSDLISALNENEESRFNDRDNRPMVEVWPDDEFAFWVSRHQDGSRHIICNTPEFMDTPFCGVGYH